MTFGQDGSFTSGNGFISVGGDTRGNLIFDISIPTGLHSSTGTTIYWSPKQYLNNVNQFINFIYGGFPFSGSGESLLRFEELSLDL